MNLILFTKYIGSPLSLRTIRSKVNVLFFIIVLFFCAAMFYAGYWLGQVKTLELSGGSIFRSDEQIVRELEIKIAENSRDAQTYLGVLMHKLYTLKSHVARLDNLGTKLLVAANVKDGEFNFKNKPSDRQVDNYSLEGVKGIQQYFSSLAKLDKSMRLREERFSALEAQLMYFNLQKKILPQGRPLKKATVSSRYGYRIHPVTRRKTFHHGIDYAAKKGTPILAVADGIVSSSESRAGYGNTVEITHGKFSTRYAHNLRNIVNIGDRVIKGQVIALVGKSGVATGFHVHFEVLNYLGKTTNPFRFVKNQLASTGHLFNLVFTH